MSGTVQKVVRIDRDDHDWFEKNYPHYGSWTWFIRTCLEKFRELHEQSSPELLDEAVKTTLEESKGKIL